MKCGDVRHRLAGYLDGALGGRDETRVREHLTSCGACREDLGRYRRLMVCLAGVDPAAPPEDLLLRIRVQASRERARRQASHALWTRAWLVFENILEPLAVPATGGILAAVLVFVFMVQSLVVGMPFGAVRNDLPTNLIQPARLESLAPFPIPGILPQDERSGAGVLLVEATINADGQVVNYHILSGPNNATVRRQIDQVLLFSRFRPELNFGRPTAGGQVLLSFGEVRVRG